MEIDINLLVTFVSLIIVPIIVTLIPIYYSRHKEMYGNRVLINLMSESPQVTISDDIRKKLKIFFQGMPVKNVIAHVLEIGNMGQKTIENFVLVFSFIPKEPDDTIDFIECQVKDRLGKTQVAPTVIFQSGKYGFVKLSREFLHSYKTYKEERIEFVVFCNTNIFIEVYGGEKDWLLDSQSTWLHNKDLLIKASYFEKRIWIYLLLIMALGIGTGLFLVTRETPPSSFVSYLLGAVMSIPVVILSVNNFRYTNQYYSNSKKEIDKRVNRIKQMQEDIDFQKESGEMGELLSLINRSYNKIFKA